MVYICCVVPPLCMNKRKGEVPETKETENGVERQETMAGWDKVKQAGGEKKDAH